MRTTFSLLILTLIISVPSLTRIPLILPFLSADVRVAAPAMLKKLREKGLWLVNVDLVKIEKTPNVCFTWKHSYKSRERVFDSELITTCIP